MKMYTACRETGDFIEEVKSIEQGLNLIEQYEREDEENGDYVSDFYEVVWEDYVPIEWFYDENKEMVIRGDTIQNYDGIYRVRDFWGNEVELEEVEIDDDGNEVMTGNTFWRKEREIKKCWKL